MQTLSFLCGQINPQLSEDEILTAFSKQSVLPSFDANTFVFIKALSDTLLKEPTYRAYPELVALGFWLRNANLKVKLNEVMPVNAQNLKAVGCAVHFTPANVDTMFVYSWLASLLLGNLNIVRVTSQDSQSKALLLSLVQHLFERKEFEEIATRNLFVTYDKTSNYTDKLSLMADARLIWGGDASVALIKQFPCKPSCVDLSFADKYSLSLIKLESLHANIDELAQLLWRDTQAFYQQACSSPRVVFFVGKQGTQAKDDIAALFSSLNALAKDSLDSWQDDTRVNEHLVTLQTLAIQSQLQSGAMIQLDTISAAYLTELSELEMSIHKGNGFFFVCVSESLEKLIKHIVRPNDSIANKIQTISVSGFSADDLEAKCANAFGHTNFRIQALGHALDFSFKWDGYNLIEMLSK